MRRRLVPHPLLTATIVVVWCLLLNDFSVSNAVLGLLVGVLVPIATSVYWPQRASVRNPLAILEYGAIVAWDIVVSNVQVAYLVLFRRGDSLRSHFVTVPLDLKSPEAIATLAGTITMTPGTLTTDVSADRRALLVHCLDTADPAATAAAIKQRYERRLKRIFE
ncbi:MAG: Na+/H+ antiporter subunit E [Xanthobacteraceae bacterium]|nr:Na+/H+ antiporter subunit E [Xanthobacteraceae bacterium]PWB65185.1 MAG: Na+/H+ antiporter subunit E [Bradyrhizobiaceae bacterium]